MAEVRELASGLKFPEGPVAMSDGSVVLVEIAGGRISRVSPDGSSDVVYVCRHDAPRGELVVVTLWEEGEDARVPRRFTDALRRTDERTRRD